MNQMAILFEGRMLIPGLTENSITHNIEERPLVDVLGNPYFVHCTRANISDDDGLLAIIEQRRDYFLSLPPEHRLTILLDNGYHKDYLEHKLEQSDPLLRERITIELSAKITP